MGNYAWTLLKVLIAVLLVPLIFLTAINFHFHIGTQYPGGLANYFIYGAATFLLTFLFIYQFWGVYEFEQSMMLDLFKFASPVNQFISHIIPFYVVLCLLIHYIFEYFIKIKNLDPFFLFVTGFFSVMHLLVSAQDLQNKETTPIKPTYLFVITVTCLVNMAIIVLLLDFTHKHFTFPHFAKKIHREAPAFYQMVFKKIVFIK